MTYSLPAEWAEQSAVLLTWPHKDTDWLPWLDDIESVYFNLVKHISHYQQVIIACHNEALKHHIVEYLTTQPASERVNSNNIEYFIAANNDSWARDHGAITLTNSLAETRVCDFRFNAWGAKYQANLDDKITATLIKQPFCFATEYQQYDMVLEGGSIESDGAGCLLTTESCLLNKNRNPDLSKAEIEQALVNYLGMKKVLWLSNGYLAGDDTDAHIDTLARFAPKGIVYQSCDDPADPHYQTLTKMTKELQQLTDINNQPYTLFSLPWPKPILNKDNEPLPATYANYLIINKAVLVPIYNDDNDQKAIEVIAQAHPKRKVIGINCRTVIEQYGSLHCLTMQFPQSLIKISQRQN